MPADPNFLLYFVDQGRFSSILATKDALSDALASPFDIEIEVVVIVQIRNRKSS